MLASLRFQADHVVEARIASDGRLHVRTRNADKLYLLLNRVVVEEGMAIESVAPADEDVGSLYRYLIGDRGQPVGSVR